MSRLRSALAVVGLQIVGASALNGQGVTGAAIQGRVTGPDGVPLPSASVVIVNLSNGERWQTVTRSNGAYSIERVSVGGPYTLSFRAIGFAPARQEGMVLSLGERRQVDAVIQPLAVALDSVVVTAETADAGRTGPSHSVSGTLLSRLPLLNRDLLDLVRESPQATLGTFGISIAGQGPTSNSFQIDGGVNNSLYGQFAATPGGLINLLSPPGGGGLRTIALDAVKELNVMVAPFDVRAGSFTGGLINAVTKSGTNTIHGSAFATAQNQWLVGKDLTGRPIPDFTTWQFGGTIGGPIIRDRVHYFLAADLQASSIPFGGALIGPDTTGGRDSVGIGIRAGSASRFQRILRDQYGVDAGSFGPLPGRNPAQSLFGKITVQAGTNSRLELSQNYVHGEDRGVLFARDPYDRYELTSTDVAIRSRTLATRVTWNAAFGPRVSNELIAAYLRIQDACRPVADFPFLTVAADAGILVAGHPPFCSSTAITQRVLELTNHVTVGFGNHRVVLGTHNELLRFHDPTRVNSSGEWHFASLDSLDQGRPDFYNRSITGPLRAEGSVANFRVRQLGFYVQDQWWPSRSLTVTAGIRVDVPLFPDRPVTNAELASALGINTGVVPHGKLLWSPRIGATHVTADGGTTIRGGVGLFAGRPAYYLPADAFRSTGLEQFVLNCEGDNVPTFTVDPARQPGACRQNEAESAARISYLDPGFRFPQELRLAFGVDRRLPVGLAGTLDLLFSRAIHQLDLIDDNLAQTGAVLMGEAGRVMYGAIDDGGLATPARRHAGFTSVIRQTNANGNRYFSMSARLARLIGRRGELSASYSYSTTLDRMSQAGLGVSFSGLGVAADQIGSTALDGTFEQRRLSRSGLDVPHQLRLSGVVNLPFGTALSIVYEGSSGTPFTYVVDGDINGDGFGPERFGQMSNDIVYVPRTSAAGGDISLSVLDETGQLIEAPNAEYDRLDGFIRGEGCLSRQRGTLLRRNSCRNPWRTRFDVRVLKSIATGGGRSIELMADVFNLLHLLNRNWGLIRRSADFGLEEVPLLRLVGFDRGRARGVYQLRQPDLRHVDIGASRWRVQLGARYVF